MTTPHPGAEDAVAAAIPLLREALRFLDLAGEAMAAISVSQALALIDGTGGALPPDYDETLR